MDGLVAEVALDGAIYTYDKLYSYLIPPYFHGVAREGARVLVPFGKGNTKKQGMIFRIKSAEIKGLKKLISVIDKEPLINKELLLMCEYLKENTFCTYYDAVHTVLPAGLDCRLVNFYSANLQFVGGSLLTDSELEIFKYLEQGGEREESHLLTTFGITAEFLQSMVEKEALIKSCDAKRKIGDATQKWVRIADCDLSEFKFTPKQSEVVRLLTDAGSAAVKEICYFTGVTTSVVEGLIKKGVLIAFEKQVFRTPERRTVARKGEITLTAEQKAAADGLLNEYNAKKGSTALLYGVTGSGKTQVYLQLVDNVLEGKRGVIVMVPEIALTEQLISIFAARYGDKIAVFHSAMSLGTRMDEWKRVKTGKALIALGTRSAIFAPFDDLGLIIIDEEQEHTYKSEKSPRFHTRDLARFRAAYHKGLLCLASATPSIESYTNALKGKYSLFTLKNRYGNATLPIVETVDMKQELLNGNSGVLSSALYEGIRDTLSSGKQAILLLNRRGHNTYVTCPECGYVATCPNCSVSLTYHSANNRLMCHYCGYSVRAENICPECGGEHIKYTGLGTQKAEEELHALFPNAKILRLDADSTVARDSYSTYLNDFRNGEYDILLGTQMVAKGLDFPNVTLVGVLGADSAMYSEDFRSFERTFSLLTQVVGRAGRGDTAGRAVIQTAGPDSDLIELARRQDYDTFYKQEILNRQLMIYPPYCDVCILSTQSEKREKAEADIRVIFERIKQLINSEFGAVKLIILGPTPAAVTKINNRYRFRMIIKCKNNAEFRKMLKEAIGDTAVTVDINPESMI